MRQRVVHTRHHHSDARERIEFMRLHVDVSHMARNNDDSTKTKLAARYKIPEITGNE